MAHWIERYIAVMATVALILASPFVFDGVNYIWEVLR